MSQWHLVFEKIAPYIVRIETQEGFGTGFLFAYNAVQSVAGIATAAHVIDYAVSWKLPIKLTHHVSGQEFFLREEDRVVYLDHARDSASILMANPGNPFPSATIPLMDAGHYKKMGVEVAWAGYPAIARPSLCLFTGTIAAFVEHQDSYLIDGVAINGVSGGPVFSAIDPSQPEILGTVSAYMPNRQRGDVFPGILRAQHVSHFHETLNTIQSFDQAAAQKEQEERERRRAEAAGERPPAEIDSDPRQEDMRGQTN